jgi:hypothetical protein
MSDTTNSSLQRMSHVSHLAQRSHLSRQQYRGTQINNLVAVFCSRLTYHPPWPRIAATRRTSPVVKLTELSFVSFSKALPLVLHGVVLLGQLILMTASVKGGGAEMPRRFGIRHHRYPHVLSLWYCGLQCGDIALLVHRRNACCVSCVTGAQLPPTCVVLLEKEVIAGVRRPNNYQQQTL